MMLESVVFWSRLFLTFLLYSCLEAMAPQQDIEVIREDGRIFIYKAAKVDPCNEKGLWFNMGNVNRARAILQCKRAYAYFDRLTDREKLSCVNAVLPACRPLFGCSELQYTCTFMCDGEVPKHLKTIAYESVNEPRGTKPLVLGGSRRFTADPRQNNFL